MRSKMDAAKHLLAVNQTTIAALDFEITPRNTVALPLLAASRDHGSSILTLLDIQRDAHGASALALIRTQLDTLLRGCFFASEATDEEIEYFLDKDEMPQRKKEVRPSKWKKQNLSLVDMIPFAKLYLELDPSNKIFEDAVQATWKGLHGMIHGGRATLNLYDAGMEIRFTLTDDGFDFALKRSVAFMQLGAAAFIRIAKQNEDEKNLAQQDLLDASRKFHQAWQTSTES